jgi:hypothetical protein
MVAAHVLAYLLVRRSLVLRITAWLVIQFGFLLAIAPWLSRYLDHGTDYPLPLYSIRYLLAVPIEYVGGNGLVLLVCMLIIVAGLTSWDGGRLRLTHPLESQVLLSWLIVPPVFMFVYSQIRRPIFGPPRYHLFIAPAYLILLARGLMSFKPILRWTLAAGAFVLSFSLLNSNVYSQVVKSDWRALARWLSHEKQQGNPLASSGAVTVVVHPSDRRFPYEQMNAARYYLDPPHRVIPADAPSAGEVGDPRAVTLDVDCLSAQQVRAGVKDLPDPGFAVPIRQQSATDFHRGLPDFYGLVVRRR